MGQGSWSQGRIGAATRSVAHAGRANAQAARRTKRGAKPGKRLGRGRAGNPPVSRSHRWRDAYRAEANPLPTGPLAPTAPAPGQPGIRVSHLHWSGQLMALAAVVALLPAEAGAVGPVSACALATLERAPAVPQDTASTLRLSHRWRPGSCAPDGEITIPVGTSSRDGECTFTGHCAGRDPGRLFLSVWPEHTQVSFYEGTANARAPAVRVLTEFSNRTGFHGPMFTIHDAAGPRVTVRHTRWDALEAPWARDRATLAALGAVPTEAARDACDLTVMASNCAVRPARFGPDDLAFLSRYYGRSVPYETTVDLVERLTLPPPWPVRRAVDVLDLTVTSGVQRTFPGDPTPACVGATRLHMRIDTPEARRHRGFQTPNTAWTLADTVRRVTFEPLVCPVVGQVGGDVTFDGLGAQGQPVDLDVFPGVISLTDIFNSTDVTLTLRGTDWGLGTWLLMEHVATAAGHASANVTAAARTHIETLLRVDADTGQWGWRVYPFAETWTPDRTVRRFGIRPGHPGPDALNLERVDARATAFAWDPGGWDPAVEAGAPILRYLGRCGVPRCDGAPTRVAPYLTPSPPGPPGVTSAAPARTEPVPAPPRRSDTGSSEAPAVDFLAALGSSDSQVSGFVGLGLVGGLYAVRVVLRYRRRRAQAGMFRFWRRAAAAAPATTGVAPARRMGTPADDSLRAALNLPLTPWRHHPAEGESRGSAVSHSVV